MTNRRKILRFRVLTVVLSGLVTMEVGSCVANHLLGYSRQAASKERSLYEARGNVDFVPYSRLVVFHPDDNTAAYQEAAPPASYVYHPYTGFVWLTDSAPRPGIRDPLQPLPEGALVVGVTGGSVAYGLIRRSDELGRLLERPVVLIELAEPGFKQPQQLMALQWWLSQGRRLDALICLDGYNEIALHSVENAPHGVSTAYPRGWWIQNATDPTVLELRADVLTQERRLDLLSTLTAWTSWLNTSALIWRVGSRQIVNAAQQDQIEVLLTVTPRSPSDESLGPPTDLPEAKVWAYAQDQLHRACLANEIVYLAYLQPVITDRIEGEITPAEINHQRTYRPVLSGIRAEAAQLKAEGFPISDLARFYDGCREQVFIDECHLTDHAYSLLVERMAEDLSEAGFRPAR